MNTQIKINKEYQILEFNMTKLTVKEVTACNAVPFVKNNPATVCFDLSNIKTVDPTGLAWLLNIVEMYRGMGHEVTAKLSRNIADALDFLDLSNELQTVVEDHNLMAV